MSMTIQKGKQPHGTPESSRPGAFLQFLQDHYLAVILFLLAVIAGLLLRLLGLL
jgi:hypothetical protein